MFNSIVLGFEKITNRDIENVSLFEKVTLVFCGMSIIFLMFAAIYTRSQADVIQNKIHTVQMDTKKTQEDNEILQTIIEQKLSSDNIRRIAEDYGLSYDLSRVITVP